MNGKNLKKKIIKFSVCLTLSLCMALSSVLSSVVCASETEAEKSKEEIFAEIVEMMEANATEYITGPTPNPTDLLNFLYMCAGIYLDDKGKGTRFLDGLYAGVFDAGVKVGVFEADGEGNISWLANDHWGYNSNGEMYISAEFQEAIRDSFEELKLEQTDLFQYKYVKFTYPYENRMNVFLNNTLIGRNKNGDYKEALMGYIESLDSSKAFGLYHVYDYASSYASVLDYKAFKYAYLNNGQIHFLDKNLEAVYPLSVLELCNSDGTLWDVRYHDFTQEDLEYTLSQHIFNVSFNITDTGIKYPFGLYYEPSYSDSIRFVQSSFISRTQYDVNALTAGTGLTLFNSYDDLLKYLTDKPIAYYTSNYHNGTYSDITLNQETLNNYTTENIQNIYNNIYNNTQDCTNADELQKVIDNTVAKELEKMNETLEDVEDNTSDMVGLLKSIDSNIKLLVAIDAADLLYDIYGDESMIRDLVDLPQKMTSFELMKKKFPFSIPWDIIHIFDMFAHEPVAPDFHFTLPISIGNGEIYEFDLHIDLTGEDWKKVSDLSRFFLLATFIVFLYRFTYRKVGKD